MAQALNLGSEVSSVLLAIYRAARTRPLPDFQSATIKLLEGIFRFDSAIWGVGISSPGNTWISGVFLHQQPERMMRSYESARAGDVTGERACARPGTAVHVSALDADIIPATRRHLLKFGMRYVQCVALPDTELGLFNFTSFYREDPGNSWSADSACLHEALMPHLVEAYMIARFRSLDQPDKRPAPVARALADENLMLVNLTPGFRQALLTEWPDWKGPHLPEPMKTAFIGHASPRYEGRRVTIRGDLASGLYVMSAKDNGLELPLSVRERLVAMHWIDGLSTRQVAQELRVSPHTVRNQIASIYSKLGVASRTELARTLGQMVP